MTPPISGPTAMPRPEPAPHTPIARARAIGSANVAATIDSDAGRISGGPSAWTTRAAISNPGSETSAQASDPAANVTSPTSSARRRP